MSDTIEINSFETVKNIEISVFPTYREININKVSGGAVTSVNGQVGDVVVETTDNNFTDILKNKLDGIAVGAEVNVNADWNATSGDALILNKPTFGDMLKTVYDKDNSGIVDNAEAVIITGRNSTGATLRRGTIIYISGSTGNRPNFVKAQANGEQTSAGTFGVIVDDINNNSDGNCCVIGYLDNLDTRSGAPFPFTNDTLNDGDTIYLSPTTAGFITNVKPSAPNHLVYLGKVTQTSPTNGTIVYRIQNGYELEELHNVTTTNYTTPIDTDSVLTYDVTNSLWKRFSFSSLKTWLDNYLTASKIRGYLGVTNLSGSNTGDQDLSGLATKSMSAYSMRVNNTNATENATEIPFQQTGKGVYTGTLTPTATVAPSGATSHSYNWQRVGNLVTLNVTLFFANQGTAVTSYVLDFMNDFPTPVKPDGLTGASDILCNGYGDIRQTSTSVGALLCSCLLRSNASNNGFQLVLSQSAISGKIFKITIQYFTA